MAVESEVSRPGRTDRVRSVAPPIAQPPALVVDDAGRFRFVEPLFCATTTTVVSHRALERSRRPNMATFVVGIIATAAGAIALVNGIGSSSEPLTYGGAAGLVVGLPLAIGPWVGRRTELVPLPDGPPTQHAGPSEPCGDRPLVASRATLELRGIEVHGTIDADGVFSISPYQLVDAYEPRGIAALAIAARVETASGTLRIESVIEGGALASKAAAFLARADFEADVEPLRLVPGLAAGTLRASLSSRDGAPMVRIVVPVENAGPGPSHGLRGHVGAPGHPAIDGRIVYLGRVAKGAKVTRELWIPVTTAAAEALRNATLELAIELRDAHGTAPATPIQFRGPLLVDAPR